MKILKSNEQIRIFTRGADEFLIFLESRQISQQESFSEFENLGLEESITRQGEHSTEAGGSPEGASIEGSAKDTSLDAEETEKNEIYFLENVEFQCRILKSNHVTNLYHIKNIDEVSKLPNRLEKKGKVINRNQGVYRFEHFGQFLYAAEILNSGGDCLVVVGRVEGGVPVIVSVREGATTVPISTCGNCFIFRSK